MGYTYVFDRVWKRAPLGLDAFVFTRRLLGLAWFLAV